jgi:hypothetical protein
MQVVVLLDWQAVFRTRLTVSITLLVQFVTSESVVGLVLTVPLQALATVSFALSIRFAAQATPLVDPHC